MVKGRRNVNFEDINTKPSTGKTFEFWLEEYLRSTSIKVTSWQCQEKQLSFSWHLQIDKKYQYNV